MDRRGAAALLTLIALLASLATALIAHAVIGWLGDADTNEGAYATYAHVALLPLVAAALTVVTIVLTVAVGKHLSRARTNAVTTVLRRIENVPFVALSAAVATGGFAVLIGMEFLEQSVAFGHIIGVSAALGGTPVIGIAVVLGAALLIALVGTAALRLLIARTVDAVVALVSWIMACASLIADGAAITRCAPVPCFSLAKDRPRSRGLRAPPRAH